MKIELPKWFPFVPNDKPLPERLHYILQHIVQKVQELENKYESGDVKVTMNTFDVSAEAHTSEGEPTAEVQLGERSMKFKFGLPYSEVDDHMSATSTNPVQNKVIYNELQKYKEEVGEEIVNRTKVKTLTIYKKSVTVPERPEGGSYDFATNTLTPPQGWAEEIEYGENDKVWMSIGSVDSETNELTWSPVVIANGSVTDGLLSKTRVFSIYKSSVTKPDTPNGGSYNFDTEILTAPEGWVNNANNFADTEIVWMSIGNVYGDGNVIKWSAPLRLTQGVGSSAITTAFVGIVYKESADSKPSKPTGGAYDFATKVFSAPSGWQTTALSGDDAWYSVRVFYANGTQTDWSEPQAAVSADVTITAAQLEVIAGKINLTSNELDLIASRVNLDVEELKTIARNVELTTDNLNVIADKVDISTIDYNLLAQRMTFTAENLAAIANNVSFTATDYQVMAEKVQFNTDQLTFIAKNVEFTNDDYTVLANNINLSSAFIEAVANKITLSANQLDAIASKVVLRANDIEAIAGKVSLNADQLAVIASKVSLTADQINTIATKIKFTTEQLQIIAGSAKITVTDDQIISAIQNSDGVGASLVMAINKDNTSSIKLKADKIELDGDTVAKSIAATDLIINGGKSQFLKDGSGHVASGNISWDKDGNVNINGALHCEGADYTTDINNGILSVKHSDTDVERIRFGVVSGTFSFNGSDVTLTKEPALIFYDETGKVTCIISSSYGYGIPSASFEIVGTSTLSRSNVMLTNLCSDIKNGYYLTNTSNVYNVSASGMTKWRYAASPTGNIVTGTYVNVNSSDVKYGAMFVKDYAGRIGYVTGILKYAVNTFDEGNRTLQKYIWLIPSFTIDTVRNVVTTSTSQYYVWDGTIEKIQGISCYKDGKYHTPTDGSYGNNTCNVVPYASYNTRKANETTVGDALIDYDIYNGIDD